MTIAAPTMSRVIATITSGFGQALGYAHFETQLMARLQFPSGGEAAKTLFLQIHYFL
jgi:hypothetical protein